MIIIKEAASNKLYHLSFRKKDKSIEKTGMIKKGSYVTNSLDYIKAFDYINGYGNTLYELRQEVSTKPDNDWENFKNDYKSRKLITGEFWEYVYWIGILYSNKINPFKENLLIINEPAKVEKINFKNNLKNVFSVNQPNLYQGFGLISLYEEYGELFSSEKHNGILIDVNGSLCYLRITWYGNRKEFRARLDKDIKWQFLNKPFKLNSEKEVIEKIQKKYKLFFV